MTAIDPTALDPVRVAGRFLRCVAGGYAAQDASIPAEDVFLESGEQLPALTGMLGPSSLAFVPAGEASAAAGAVVEYAGRFADPGDEVELADELFIQVQDYAGSAFACVAGPTLVRVDGPDDFDAFLSDADQAVATGTFPAQLTHPAVTLADVCCLAGAPACPGLVRLHVSAGGELRTSMRGRVLGLAGDALGVLEANLRRQRCACTAIEPARRTEALAARPWLPRYVAALEALRRLRAHERPDARVSGFGQRLVPGLETDQREGPALPLLLWDEDGCVLFDLSGRRVLRLGRDAARLLELAFVTGSRAAAADRARMHLGLDATLARTSLDALLTRVPAAGLAEA